jgi:hypothetical protein
METAIAHEFGALSYFGTLDPLSTEGATATTEM